MAHTSLQAALDTADSAARTMATGVVMRRSAWLQVSGILSEVQTTIQDLPFEGSGLFSEQTDSKLHSLKDSRVTLKSLGIHTPAPPTGVPSRLEAIPDPFSGGKALIGAATIAAPTFLEVGVEVLGWTQREVQGRHLATRLSLHFEGMPESRGSVTPIYPPFGDHLFLNQKWAKITSDRWVLDLVKQGYTIPFLSYPALQPLPVPFQGPLS